MGKSYICLLGRLILLCCIVFILEGCKKQQTLESVIPERVIDFSQCIQKSWEELPDSLFGKKEYILLDTTHAECDFGEMSKVIIRNDRIYILDAHLKKLVVYNMQGKGIGQVGKRGQGPEEYLDISDFDVSANGDIYFIDGRLDKLFCFGRDLRFSYRKELPFEADVVSVLDTGGFLFGLSSWNKGACEGYKIVRTDEALKVNRTYLEYDEYVDPTYWISTYTFIRSADCLSYNQPIDNHIYVFDEAGVPIECIRFDFADRNVPDEYKKDIEKYLPSFDQCYLLKNFVVVTEHIIAGALWINRQTVPFVFDLAQDICYLSDPKEDYDHSYMAGYSGSRWITYIEPDMEQQEVIPDSVSEYVEKGGFVLGLQLLQE